jgi:hypothetical protein
MLRYSKSPGAFPATGAWGGADVPVTDGRCAIPVIEGVNEIYVGAIDQAGNPVVTELCTFNIDRTSPSISVSINGVVLEIEKAKLLVVDEAATITVTADDPLPPGVSICSGIKTGSLKYTKVFPAPSGDEGWSTVGDDFSFSREDTAGECVYTFKVLDNAGNGATLVIPVRNNQKQ